MILGREAQPVPMYRFDLVSVSERLPDLRCVEARDDEHAISEALAALQEMAQEGPIGWFGWSLEIYENDTGRFVLNIPLSHFAVDAISSPDKKEDDVSISDDENQFRRLGSVAFRNLLVCFDRNCRKTRLTCSFTALG
jgi:hypothetical protein